MLRSSLMTLKAWNARNSTSIKLCSTQYCSAQWWDVHLLISEKFDAKALRSAVFLHVCSHPSHWVYFQCMIIVQCWKHQRRGTDNQDIRSPHKHYHSQTLVLWYGKHKHSLPFAVSSEETKDRLNQNIAYNETLLLHFAPKPKQTTRR